MTGPQLMAAGVGIAIFGALGVIVMASTALDPAERAPGIGSAIGGVVFYELLAVFGIWARELGARRKARFAQTQGPADAVRDGTDPAPQTQKTRAWYKKKFIIIPLGLLPLLIPIGVFSLAGQDTTTAPNVVGLRLDSAHNALKASDLFTYQEVDVIGTGRTVMLDHNWVVLVQSPAAGTAGVTTTTETKLSVGKVDDPEIRDRLPKDSPVMVELAAADERASAQLASEEADAAARAARAADQKAARDAATAAAARAKAAAAAALVDPATYAPIGQRAFALVAKDPDAHTGEKYVLYGVIRQFDPNTGPSAFRADTDGVRHSQSYDYDVNTFVQAEHAKMLANLIEGDIVKMYIQVIGAYSYDTQIGGNTTATKVQVNIIKFIG